MKKIAPIILIVIIIIISTIGLLFISKNNNKKNKPNNTISNTIQIPDTSSDISEIRLSDNNILNSISFNGIKIGDKIKDKMKNLVLDAEFKYEYDNIFIDVDKNNFIDYLAFHTSEDLYGNKTKSLSNISIKSNNTELKDLSDFKSLLGDTKQNNSNYYTIKYYDNDLELKLLIKNNEITNITLYTIDRNPTIISNSVILQREISLSPESSYKIAKVLKENGIDEYITIKSYKFYKADPDSKRIPPEIDTYSINVETDSHKSYKISTDTEVNIYSIFDENDNLIYNNMLE